MAIKDRTSLKVYFETGKRPVQQEFEDLIDSNLNIIEDKASLADASNDSIDDKFLTPKSAKEAVQAFAPVKKVNNILPDVNGNIEVQNITGSASTITGTINKNQVVGLENDLEGKQEALVSGTTIKTLNGASVLGSGNIEIISAKPKHIGVLSSNFALSNSNTEQNAFPSLCDQFALADNKTYFFKGKFLINNGTVSHITSMGWSVASGLVVTSMEYVARLCTSAIGSTSTGISTTQVSGTSSKTLNNTNIAASTTIEFEGVLRCSTGGVITPKITFSAAPGGTNIMRIGSFIEFTEIGSDTVQTVGSVS